MRIVLLASACLLLVATSPLGAQPDPQEPLKQTVRNVRNLGTALFSWFTDHGDIEGRLPVPEDRVDLGSIGAVSLDEVEAMLVPRYILEMPRRDGWGNPLEVRLERVLEGKVHAAAIRAPAADGEFSSDTYEIGGYSATDLDHDVVWVDGYFVAYPKAENR